MYRHNEMSMKNSLPRASNGTDEDEEHKGMGLGVILAMVGSAVTFVMVIICCVLYWVHKHYRVPPANTGPVAIDVRHIEEVPREEHDAALDALPKFTFIRSWSKRPKPPIQPTPEPEQPSSSQSKNEGIEEEEKDALKAPRESQPGRSSESDVTETTFNTTVDIHEETSSHFVREAKEEATKEGGNRQNLQPYLVIAAPSPDRLEEKTDIEEEKSHSVAEHKKERCPIVTPEKTGIRDKKPKSEANEDNFFTHLKRQVSSHFPKFKPKKKEQNKDSSATKDNEDKSSGSTPKAVSELCLQEIKKKDHEKNEDIESSSQAINKENTKSTHEEAAAKSEEHYKIEKQKDDVDVILSALPMFEDLPSKTPSEAICETGPLVIAPEVTITKAVDNKELTKKVREEESGSITYIDSPIKKTLVTAFSQQYLETPSGQGDSQRSSAYSEISTSYQEGETFASSLDLYSATQEQGESNSESGFTTKEETNIKTEGHKHDNNEESSKTVIKIEEKEQLELNTNLEGNSSETQRSSEAHQSLQLSSDAEVSKSTDSSSVTQNKESDNLECGPKTTEETTLKCEENKDNGGNGESGKITNEEGKSEQREAILEAEDSKAKEEQKSHEDAIPSEEITVTSEQTEEHQPIKTKTQEILQTSENAPKY